MTDDTLERYRDDYYTAILSIQDEQDVLKSLPLAEYENFFPLMEGVISKLVKEYEDFQEFGDDSEFLDTVASLKKKIDICKNRVEEVRKQIAEDSIESQTACSKRHLIFAKTTFGSTFLQ